MFKTNNLFSQPYSIPLFSYQFVYCMRLLSITRSGPLVVSMNDLFISISTGLVLILNYNYFIPLISSADNNYSLYSILYSLLYMNLVKLVFQAIFSFFARKRKMNEDKQNREIPFIKLIYTTAIKVAAHLCAIFLLVTINGITFPLTLFLTFLFIFSLEYYSKNDRIIKILWKGRGLGSNKIKFFITGLLVLGSIALQPLSYDFMFQLHFQIFIVFTSSLMFFSFYYLHKLLLTTITKESISKSILQMSFLQTLFLSVLIVYYALIQENGLSFIEQMSSLYSNILLFIGISFLNFIYEMVLIESLKKVAVNRLTITKITGLLWFNVYIMFQLQIDLRHYISVIIMFFVLLVNIQMFSEENIKGLLTFFSIYKKKKKKTSFSEMEMKQSENDH